MSEVPRLHVITDDARLADARFVDDAAAVLEAGGADVALHVRGRNTTAARLFEIAAALLPAARANGARLLVNDRVDVALAAHADGAQLREDSMPAAAARALLGQSALIGVSRHDPSAGASIEGADFVVFGSVYATGTHPGRAPAGLDAVRGIRCEVPLIAIGGITPQRVADVLAAGAHGIAALSGIWAHGPSAVRDYLDALGRTDTANDG